MYLILIIQSCYLINKIYLKCSVNNNNTFLLFFNSNLYYIIIQQMIVYFKLMIHVYKYWNYYKREKIIYYIEQYFSYEGHKVYVELLANLNQFSKKQMIDNNIIV